MPPIKALYPASFFPYSLPSLCPLLSLPPCPSLLFPPGNSCERGWGGREGEGQGERERRRHSEGRKEGSAAVPRKKEGHTHRQATRGGPVQVLRRNRNQAELVFPFNKSGDGSGCCLHLKKADKNLLPWALLAAKAGNLSCLRASYAPREKDCTCVRKDPPVALHLN
jgi:hypothetical protein